MDAPIIAALIGVFGTGLLAALGFIFTGLRAGIRDNSTRSGRLEAAFVRLEERFGGLEQRVGRLEAAFVRLEERFGGLEQRVGRLEAAFVRLEERFGGIEERVGGLEERFGGLEQRVGRFEERTISEFGQIKDVLTRIEATQAEQGRLIEKLSGGDIV